MRTESSIARPLRTMYVVNYLVIFYLNHRLPLYRQNSDGKSNAPTLNVIARVLRPVLSSAYPDGGGGRWQRSVTDYLGLWLRTSAFNVIVQGQMGYQDLE